MTEEERDQLLGILRSRFDSNMNRHEGLEWAEVKAKLEASPDKLRSLHEMERTGGEPDVIGYDEQTGEFIWVDCSAESPKGRRSVCCPEGRSESESLYMERHLSLSYNEGGRPRRGLFRPPALLGSMRGAGAPCKGHDTRGIANELLTVTI